MGSSGNRTGKVHPGTRHFKLLSLCFWFGFFSLFLFLKVRRVGKNLGLIVVFPFFGNQ